MFRELETVGIKRPSLYDLNFAHNNCFHRDTEVLTTDGVFKIGDLVGQQKTVIGWQRSQVSADFKSFGEQILYRLKFKRDYISKEVLATLDHEWFARGPLGRWKRVKSQDLVFGNRLITLSGPDWKFVGLEETGIIDEVFCAVVNDEHHAFSLTDGLLTSNCGGFCVKTGKAQFKMLLEKLPETYAFHEQKEQEAIASSINHKGFIKHVKKGVLYYLTMKQFRELQAKLVWSAEDLLDLGGCGCFSDSEEGEE